MMINTHQSQYNLISSEEIGGRNFSVDCQIGHNQFWERNWPGRGFKPVTPPSSRVLYATDSATKARCRSHTQ